MFKENYIMGQELPEGYIYSKIENTKSMLPTLGQYSQVICDTNYVYIQEGDIIIFNDGFDLVIHRVAQLTTKGYITKADRTGFRDKEIGRSQVICKVIAILY